MIFGFCSGEINEAVSMADGFTGVDAEEVWHFFFFNDYR